MPGEEGQYPFTRDMYPKTEEEHKKLLSWATDAFNAADRARQPYYERWTRQYKLYHHYMRRRKGEWQSKVFYPMVFYVVETLAPRLISSMPKPLVLPVGPEDVEPARAMETTLDWHVANSDLYPELVMAAKSALKYGTGILQTRWEERKAISRKEVPVMAPQMAEQPVLDENGEQMYDPGGMPMNQQVELPGEQPMLDEAGEPLVEYQSLEYTIYEGPWAEAVDIFNFWVAPEATNVQDARYVIQRVYRDWSYIQQKVKEGIYKLPEWLSEDEIASDPDRPTRDRLGEIEMDSGGEDPTRKPQELLVFWTADNLQITVLNQRAIIRVTDNPYDHGEKPFIRIVDVLNEHEFWGTGEIEPLEGLQDLLNAQVNQRVDNVRLVLNKMFAVNIKEIADPKELESRPGGIIRMTGDMPIQDALQGIDFGDVTGSAFEEAAFTERFSEKVSGVSSFQLGVETPSMNRTATGASLMNDASDTRFGVKNRLMELLGLKPLFRQWGALLQQFMSEEKSMRLLGPERGSFQFLQMTPEAIQGALDYDIEASSATQTEAVRKDQSMTLFQTVAPFWPQAVPKLLEDVLREFGVKDTASYIQGPPGMFPPPGMEEAPPEEEVPPNGEPPPEELAALQEAMMAQPPAAPPPMGG